MSIKIITDSSCDLPDELLKKLNIEIVPLKVSFENGETYLERFELNPVLFASKMRSFKTLPKTSTPDPATMITAFTKGLSEAENVLFICLSSMLSGTCQTAYTACYSIGSDRIRVFDSKSVSLGTGILAIKAVQMAEQGFTLNEIFENLSIIRKSSEVIFTLDTLENVVKGGRLKRHEGLLGNLINIKPIMRINEEGLVEIVERTRGRKKATKRLLDMIGEYAGESVKNRLIGISHVNCLTEAEDLAAAIKNRYKPREEIIISEMGSTIGTYAGEGGLAISL
ncbi:MAG TPA: DegV family protein [Syntrophomonadaceae bacterium]|nr:DegV family protein [Syntrophomonadaceae bacterium]